MNSFRDQQVHKLVSIGDIKDVSRRIAQLSYMALIVSSITFFIHLADGIYISAILLGILFLCIAASIVLNNRGYNRFAKPFILTTIIVFIFLLSASEGLASGAYIYYLPLLFALPLLKESSKPYKQEFIYYFLLNCTAFCACVFFCPQKSLLQNISDDMYTYMFRLNAIGALLVGSFFVYFNFYFEKKFTNALVNQIARAEDAMHVRTRFLSNMGHELRTPLNGISGIISLMKREPLPAGQQEYLDLLRHCSDQMLGLVNDVLDFNKIEVGKLELHPVAQNLKHLMEKSVLPFHYRFEEKNVSLKVQLDSAIDETILTDDIRLVQVVNNLLSNALKFTNAGQVKLTAECLQKDNRHLVVRFSVQDSGIGIDKQDQKKIFESFGQVINENTRKQQGAGLGLTISKRLLEMMNSKLQVTSEPGQGSTFFFTCSFPRVNVAAAPVINRENFDLNGMKIFIAEDNPINLMIITRMLRSWNAEVDTAINGSLAINALSNNAGYNLILLDLQMPEMDGYEAVAEIKKSWPSLPVLAFTASLISDTMMNELLVSGFAGYISKPFKSAELYDKVKVYHESITTTSPLPNLLQTS